MAKAWISILILLFSTQMSFGQGIEFFHGTWSEALVKAQTEDKAIFVDAYASWCGPCKRMAATTFKEQKVGDFFNENFINVKLDMEKDKERKKGFNYSVSAYPTLIFVDQEGEMLHKSVGGKDAEKLLQAGALALKNNDRSDQYVKEYEDGNRDYKLVLNYVKALNKVNKPSLKISNDYINSKPDITNEEMVEFLYEAVVEADSRLFDKLTAQNSTVKKIKSEKEYNDKIILACKNTVQKAVQYESHALLDEAKSKLKENLKSESKKFDIEADMVYYKGTKDIDKYIDATKKYAKKVVNKNAEALSTMAQEMAKDMQRYTSAVALSEELAKKAVDIEENSKYLMTYSQILLLNGKKEEALKQAIKAKDLAKEQGESTKQPESLIRYLESQ